MKRTFIRHFIFILLIALNQGLTAEEGGWYQRDGTPAPNTDAMKSINGFGGWLVVTPDKDWETKWNTPADHTPHFTEAKKVRYGEELTILVFYINPETTDAGDVDIRCDIRITRPDGTASIDVKDVECAKERIQGNPRMVRLSRMFLKYIGEDGDPPGTWVVNVVITDNVRHTRVPLKTHFVLLNETAKTTTTPTAPDVSLATLNQQMSYFYTHPSEAAFVELQQNADQLYSQISSNGNGADILTAVLIARISKKHGWPIIQSAYHDRAKEILAGQSPLAKFIADDTQVNPGKLDVWWVSYFATGETRYLDHIYHYAGMELPRGNTEKLLVVGAAKWSFKSNCQRHPAIQLFAKGKLVQASESQREYLQTCLKGEKEG